MFWQECKKLWKRPAVLLVFMGMCLFMTAQIWQNNPPADRETRKAYQKYAGVMDEEWRERIRKEWEGTEEKKRSSVLYQAYLYSNFQELLENYVESVKGDLSERDSGFDLERVDLAYEALGKEKHLRFDTAKSFWAFIINLNFLKYCVIFFLILLCGAVFTGEREMGMYALLAVCSKGGRKLFWRKFIACQFSSFALWMVMNGLAVGTIWLRLGWSGLEGLVQDFSVNVSPFPWNQRTYLWVVGLTGLAACQLVSSMVFFVAYVSRKSVQSVLGSFGILFLPVAGYSFFDAMRFLFPNFLSGDYLWNRYGEWRIGPWYISEWKMAAVQMAVLYLAVLLWCIYEGGYRKWEKY